MAQPTHVTISYRRQVQPAQYEAEEVKLEGSFAVEEGEDFEAVAYDMVARARVQAHRVLGRPEPVIEPYSPFSEETAFSLGKDVGPSPKDFEKPKRKRRTKAEMEAARAAEQEKPADDFDPTDASPADTTAAGAATGDDFDPTTAEEHALANTSPDDFDPTTEQKQPKPAANGADDDFVIDEPKEISDAELQATASKIAKALGGPKPVQKVMAEYGVNRLGELAADKRAAFVKDLEALKA